MAIVARYRANPDWEDVVVNATATAPGVQAACRAKAGEIAGAAVTNLMQYTPSGPSERIDQQDVLSEVGTLPVETFTREKTHAGTVIPVALAVADHPASQRWELGSGHRIPGTRFMRKAAGAKAGARWKFIARGPRGDGS